MNIDACGWRAGRKAAAAWVMVGVVAAGGCTSARVWTEEDRGANAAEKGGDMASTGGEREAGEVRVTVPGELSLSAFRIEGCGVLLVATGTHRTGGWTVGFEGVRVEGEVVRATLRSEPPTGMATMAITGFSVGALLSETDAGMAGLGAATSVRVTVPGLESEKLVVIRPATRASGKK